jgi:TRAP-type C4-dicarboxylate transport system permease small subunit
VDRWWLAGVNALSAASCGVFFWYSLQLVIKAMHTNQKTIALGLPMWLVYGSMSLGAALMAGRFLLLIWSEPLADIDEALSAQVIEAPEGRSSAC